MVMIYVLYIQGTRKPKMTLFPKTVESRSKSSSASQAVIVCGDSLVSKDEEIPMDATKEARSLSTVYSMDKVDKEKASPRAG